MLLITYLCLTSCASWPSLFLGRPFSQSHCYDIDWSLVFTEGIDVPLLRDALSHALGAFPSLAGRVVSSSLKVCSRSPCELQPHKSFAAV